MLNGSYRRSVCLIVLAVLSAPRAALAASSPVNVAIDGAAACGDPAAVEARLVTRGIALSHQHDAPVVTLSFTQTDSGMQGALELDRDGTTTRRVVSAPTCDEVIDALAFTLELALEEDTSRTPAAPAVPVLDRASPLPPDRMPVEAKEGTRFAAGLVAGMTNAVSLGGNASLGAWAMIERRRTGWFSPAVAIGGLLALPAEESGSSLRATSALQAATVHLCPARLGPTMIGVRPCARGLLGRSQVRSEGFLGARMDERLFATVGLAARAEAILAAPFALHAEVDIGLPLERTRYFVDNISTFQTPAVALGATIGAGVHFP